MPIAILTDRAVIRISGADAEHFLQNLITTDLDGLAEGEARPGALLTPQGKILFDFLVSRDGEGGFLLDCPAGAAEDFMRRLTLYKLRAKVDISLSDQMVVTARWQDDSSASHTDSTVPAALRDRQGLSGAASTRQAHPGRTSPAPPRQSRSRSIQARRRRAAVST